ncbi:MAG: radical SAM protein, partial [Candidatus Cloacimonetes bacterium]|nr:radical SAM protein [Candidatus Cloacimonadota bacterium]
ILELIIAENLNKQLCFATELRADLLTKEQIEKMSLANIVEVEVGLQSTNPIALKAMNRTQNLTKIVENVKLMQILGIACKVDLIVGLPQDTLRDFKKSVDFLYEQNLFDDIQVFPLSVLSGTDFRKDKEKLGLEIMEKSPYYLKSSPTFSHEDFLAAFAYAEKKFGIDLYTLPELWLATNSLHQFENYAHKIILDFNNINLPITNLSESFYLHLKISAALDNYDLDKFFQQFEMLKSHYLFTFVFDWQREPTESEIIQILALLPHHKDHYVNRDLYPYLGDDVMVSTRWAMLIPYQYSQNHELREFAQNNPVYFKINGEDINDSILKELYLFVENMDEKHWGFIKENYEYDQLQFQNWEYQKKWNLYHEINVEIDDLIIGEFNSLRLPL